MNRYTGGFPISKRPGYPSACSRSVNTQVVFGECKAESCAQPARFLVKHSSRFSSRLALHISSFSDMDGRLLGNQVVVLWIEAACPAPVLKGKPGPERCIVAIGIEIPTFAPRCPDSALHPLLHLGIKCFLYLGQHVYSPQSATIHLA